MTQVDVIKAKHVQMAAVITVDRNRRKGTGSPLLLARARDTGIWAKSKPLSCSRDMLFYQAETEPVLHECKCDISNAFSWSYEQTVTNLSTADVMRKPALNSFLHVWLQKPMWEWKEQFFSVPVKPCRKCSNGAFRRSGRRLYSDESFFHTNEQIIT